MNKQKIIVFAVAISFLAITSCNQKICPAYAQKNKAEKKNKKESRF